MLVKYRILLMGNIVEMAGGWHGMRSYKNTFLMCKNVYHTENNYELYHFPRTQVYSEDLNNEPVHYSNGPNLSNSWMACYSGHDLNNEVLPVIWKANMENFVIRLRAKRVGR